MDRLRAILSKTVAISRLHRYRQIVRPFSIQQTDSCHQQLKKIPFQSKQNHSFSRRVVQFSSIPRSFSSDVKTETPNLSPVDYEHYSAETLESLTDYFDELAEKFKEFTAADVVYQDGVLTVNLGKAYGIYVINKQTPNKQIWLSSPRSGPKRFDYAPSSGGANHGYWIYKHTGEVLHELLDREFSEIVSTQTNFQQLPFGSRQ